MGVVGDARAKKPVANTWPPYTPSRTSYIPNKQPPSGGYAAISPKGEALELIIKRKRSSYDALSSGFQLAQVYDLLGWNDEVD